MGQVDDLLYRTLVHLTQTKEELPQFNSPIILLAENIYPSTVLQLDPAVVKGICLSAGSPVSHSALIARELGLAGFASRVRNCMRYNQKKR